MDSRIAQLNKIAPRRIRAQAALWVTELHGPDRDAALEARVRVWIAENPQHAAAFELATEAWQRSGDLPATLPKRVPGSIQSPPSASISGRAIAGMVTLCLALVFTVHFLRNDALVTGPEEQKTVELSDGTQVSLNANSRVLVQYNDRVRKVTLTNGEALFNVVKHQARPFIVIVGERKIVAMGTSFVVRREEAQGSAFAVTLMEGRVAIEPISGPDILSGLPLVGVKLLTPGERLRFTGSAIETVDSPSIEKVTAWQRGQLIFEDTSLSEAAAEFNRYGSHKISIDNPAIGKLRVGGVFRIGDTASFAQAMVNEYRLRIIGRGDSIVLTDRQPTSN